MATELVASLRLRLHDEVSGEARRIEHAMRSAAGGAASATEALRLKQLEAGTAVRTLSVHFRQLQSSGKATEQELREVATALVRARESAAGFARQARELAAAERQAAQQATGLGAAVEQTSTRTAAGAKQTTAAVGMVSDAAKNRGRDLGGIVNVGAEMAYSFGTAIPQLRGAGMQMAMMGGTAYQLGAAFGPLGVAIGVVVGLAPTLISFFTSAGGEAEELARRTQEAADSFQELRAQIQRMREEERADAAAQRGQLDVEQQEQRVAEAVALEAGARTERDNALRRFGLGASGERLSDASQRRQAIEALIARGLTGDVDTDLARAQEVVAGLEAEGATFSGRRGEATAAVLQGARVGAPLTRTLTAREEQTARARTALEVAQRREEEEARAQEVQARPQRVRTQLEDLATVRQLTASQRQQLLRAAERGTALPSSLAGQLGPDAARASQLAGQLGSAERAAAAARLGVARTEDLVQGLDPAGPGAAPAREQVRRAVRARLPTGPSTTAPTASPELSAGSLDALERLAGPRRVEVDVRVSDDRVRVTTRDVDASASDPMGGQG